jgi:endonuclease III
LIGASIPLAKVHAALEDVVAPALRYSVHVNAVAHGRKVCLALRPRCTDCPLRRLCPYPSVHEAAMRRAASSA